MSASAANIKSARAIVTLLNFCDLRWVKTALIRPLILKFPAVSPVFPVPTRRILRQMPGLSETVSCLISLKFPEKVFSSTAWVMSFFRLSGRELKTEPVEPIPAPITRQSAVVPDRPSFKTENFMFCSIRVITTADYYTIVVLSV